MQFLVGLGMRVTEDREASSSLERFASGVLQQLSVVLCC
jgi:hypothetical protein